jgi:peroxisomal membrane protein 4
MSAAALATGVVQGIRNGLFYGMKIRGPHATLMTFIFRWNDPLNSKLWNIVNLACTHARNLGSFALVYKVLQLVLKQVLGSHAALISGGIGGYLIWGTKNSVNEQVNMYLFSRVLATGAYTLASKGILPTKLPLMSPFQWFGTLVWCVTRYRSLRRKAKRHESQISFCRAVENGNPHVMTGLS